MNCNFTKFKKAALINAAFLFLAAPSFAKPVDSIDNIRNKTGELLALKQKDKAIQLILNYLKTERSRAYRSEASELLFDLGQSFMAREAQQEYETSLIDTLDNEKKSYKAAEACLKLEPQNLDCLIQRARLSYRSNSLKNFNLQIEEVKNLLTQSTYEGLFVLFLDRQSNDFKEKQILTSLPATPNERTLFYVIFELDRSFQAKNYSRAKEVINYAEKNYQDWPDLAFYKNRLNIESAENGAKTSDELLTLYTNKCKNLARSLVRKYRYDFDLCRRS